MALVKSQTLSFKFLDITHPAAGVCHCQLSRPPVNAFNTSLWSELLTLLTFLEKHRYPQLTRVLVFSSAARGNIFSAGNDLTELHVPSTSRSRFITFWTTCTLFLARLYKTPLYTIAALRGSTPAGGCCMALCCDYRVALANTTMGLNEVAIGLSVPRFWARLLVRTATVRSEAEDMLLRGTMISAQSAKRIGLLDRVLEGNPSKLISAALRSAKTFSVTEAQGRAGTKLAIREVFADEWESYANEEAQGAWEMLSEQRVIQSLGSLISRLSTRKAKM